MRVMRKKFDMVRRIDCSNIEMLAVRIYLILGNFIK
jgi:hypothetical protein